MAYGAIITDTNGKQWVTPDAPPLNLVNRFNFSLPTSGQLNTYINTWVPDYLTCVIFTKWTSGNQTFNGQMVKLGGYWQYDILSAGTGGYAAPTATNFTVYVFANQVTAISGWGVQIYGASGQPTWNDQMMPLQIKSAYLPLTETLYNMGHGVAVMPAASQWALIYEDGVSYYYSSSFNAKGTNLERASTQVEDGMYANENEGIINRTCYYINTDVYDSY